MKIFFNTKLNFVYLKMEINEEQLIAEERARKFIAKHNWKFAKTMPWVPHYYIVRPQLTKEDQLEFNWMVMACRKWGTMLKWGKKEPKPYWFIDEYKYWTMGDLLEETTILNRAEHHV